MRTTFISILIIVMGALIHAQNTIKGSIKDENNSPLPGVIVQISLINKNIISDANGYFELKNLTAGQYLLEFKLLGYQTISKKINLQKREISLDISMYPSAREIDEIVVTSAADAIQQKENPVPFKTIDFNSLNQQASNNIIEAIGKKDNVWALSTGLGIAKPIIRGLGYNRAMVLVNGLRQEGQQWGDEHGVEIDQYSVQKAEIIKGPGSIMYGSDALAGIVNFIPHRIVKEGWSGKYFGLFQSNNQMIANSAIIQYKKNDYGFYLQATQKDAGNYQNAIDGKIFGTGFNERSISAVFQINKQWGYAHVFASAFTQQLNMPEGNRDSLGRFLKYVKTNDTTVEQEPVSDADLNSYKLFIPYQYIQHYRVQNYSVFNLKNTDKIITNIGYQYNIRDEYGPHSLLEEGKKEKKYGELSMHLRTLSYQIKYLKNIDSTQLLSIGATGMYQMNFNKGEELLIPDYNLLDAGMYIYYQKILNKWTFSGGIRWDIRDITSEPMYLDSTGKVFKSSQLPPGGSIKFNSFSKQYNNLSGTAGFVYSGWKNALFKFNIARGFRSPNLSELTSNGAHEGTVRYEYGNPQLKPEISYQTDIGMSINKEHFLFEISPFVNYIDNYIYFNKLSSVLGGDSIINQDKENLWAFTYNQAKALVYGGEVSIDLHPHPLDWLHYEINYSYLQAKVLNQPDSTQYLPFFPPSRLTQEIKAEWNHLNNLIKNIFAKVEVIYVFPQNRFFKAYNTETYTPDYTLLNASVGIAFNYFRENKMHFITGVNNLLDLAYQDHLNRLKYVRPNPATGRMGLYNMGRNIFVRLIVDF